MHISTAVATAEYSRSIDGWRNIPHMSDMLKPVQKRIVWCGFKATYNQSSNQTKFTKSISLVGDVIKMHPHSDDAIYCAMAKQVMVGSCFDKQGNFGTNGLMASDGDKADPKYTELKMKNSVAREIALVSPYYTMVDMNSNGAEEPVNIITMIPLGIIGEGIIKGVGTTSTCIPRYSRTDLTKRLRYLIDDSDTSNPIIEPNINHCTLKPLKPDSFETLLTQGFGSFQVEVVMSMEDSKTMVVHGRHPLVKTSALESHMRKTIVDGTPKYYIDDQCSIKDPIRFAITMADRSDITEAFTYTIRNLVYEKISFSCVVVNFVDPVSEDHVNFETIEVGIDEILRRSYTNWIAMYKSRLSDDLVKSREELKKVLCLQIIRIAVQNSPKIHQVSDIISTIRTMQNNSQSLTTDQKQLASQSTDQEFASICDKYSTTRLITSSGKSSIKDINDRTQRIAVLESELANADAIVLNRIIESLT